MSGASRGENRPASDSEGRNRLIFGGGEGIFRHQPAPQFATRNFPLTEQPSTMSHSDPERGPSVGKDDQSTTVAELREIMRQFVDERDWQQFHSPKNLSMSMAIEVGELMEHFQWLTVAESNALAADRPAVAEIGEEMADVLCYLLGLANRLDVDLSQAVRNKMVKNRQKYPTEHFLGRYGHKRVAGVNPETDAAD